MSDLIPALCCWIQPGQTVELEIHGIGALSNAISTTAVPATVVPL
jgi:2-keto-4-pentenoate hydratase/2-oxohepta-3-ene-1,7-dioic acid hydratase in catechol pathway